MEYDMVFEGGGAKGMVFVGALMEMEKRGITPSRLLGASAGAIMATLLAAGYNSQEMMEALTETVDDQPVFLGFLEDPPQLSREEVQNSAVRKLLADVDVSVIPNILEPMVDDAIASLLAKSGLSSRLFNFIEKGGFYAADNFIEWLRTKLNSGTYELERGVHAKGSPRGFGEMNLAEFNAATGVDLSLIGSDTTDSQLLVLNHRTAPACPVVRAVRMSMSFPLLWNEVVWQPSWGTYRDKDLSGHTVVDGGLLSNFPIELFISKDPHVTAVMGDKRVSDLHLIGFLIDEKLDVPGAPQVPKVAKAIDVSQFATVQRIMKLINTVTQAHDKSVIEAHERFVVRLPAKGYGTIEFGMSEAKRQALVEAGRSVTDAYLAEVFQPASRALGAPPVGPQVDLGAALSSADRVAVGILGR